MNTEEQKKTSEIDELKLEVVEKMTTLATAGFGLVAALAWNSAIQDLFGVFFPDQESLVAKFLYALVITIFIVFVTIRLGKVSNKLKKSIKE